MVRGARFRQLGEIWSAAFWQRRTWFTLFIGAFCWLGAATLVGAMVSAGPARSAGTPFAPLGIADRIVLTPGADPAREMAIAYRTSPDQQVSEAQLARAIDGPALVDLAISIEGRSPPREINSANGPALYHRIDLSGLDPDTVYAYRLKGSAGWGEWLQFRTASASPAPFRFLYLGDVQNGILSEGSRVIRQALGAHGGIALVLHAGDMVDQRGRLDRDDEWGEWNAAAGYHYAVIPQIPAAGNHEYDNLLLPQGDSRRRLSAYWPAQFALPSNGATSAGQTTYFVDYQGVRFIVLDGTSATDLGTLDAQTRWLDRTLADSKASWNVVLMHQPLFSCGRPTDSESLKAAWKPVFERRKVDLVLQGHDHCYSRTVGDAPKVTGVELAGPVYMVSVAGAKMYALNDRTVENSSRAAEATQLYQIVDVTQDRLRVQVFTASGRLYDSFDLERIAGGLNVLIEGEETKIAQRLCENGISADGVACRLKTKKVAFGL